MYLTFYGLLKKPFNPTPDPRFLYLTPGHREALAQLVYGVQEKKGFIVLTGEVGTGKTTLLRTLMQRLDRNTEVAFVFNSKLSFDDILEYMLEDMGIGKAGDTPAQRQIVLNNFLIDRQRSGRNTVLILDEAQNLDPPTLEQIRLLSNFETPTEKLLQILLVGQPELNNKLQTPELRQLRQRIGHRCHIPVMTAGETRDFIRHRLRVAGALDAWLFTDAAAARISQYAAGIPRVVNMLCDHCLVFGYAEQQRKIDEGIVEQAIEYLEEGIRPRQRTWGLHWRRMMTPRWWVLGTMAAVLLGGVLGLSLRPEVVANASSSIAASLLNFERVVRDLVTR